MFFNIELLSILCVFPESYLFKYLIYTAKFKRSSIEDWDFGEDEKPRHDRMSFFHRPFIFFLKFLPISKIEILPWCQFLISSVFFLPFLWMLTWKCQFLEVEEDGKKKKAEDSPDESKHERISLWCIGCLSFFQFTADQKGL